MPPSEATELERPTRRSYTEDEVQRGLTVLAWCGGNSRLAARHLEENETPIPRETLRCWAKSKADQLEQIREALLPEIQERIAAEAEAMALAAAELEADTLEHLRSTLHELKPSEAAGALRNITTSKGINIDKARLMRDKPTSIVGRETDADAIFRALTDLQPKHVDATSEDVTDAVVVSSSPADTR